MRDSTKDTMEKAARPDRKAYAKPEIRSEQVFERTALACSGAPFPNALYNTKKNSSSCGYADS